MPLTSRTSACMPRRLPLAGALTWLLICALLSGCHISHSATGKSDNVDIGTPFGSMHVNTDSTSALAGIGLTPYPGAVPVKGDDNDDNDAANVNMSFGSFHLGVRAASFESQDSEDKVLSFYRSDLGRYGEVIECRGNSAVGTPARTSQGLTCDEEHHSGGHVHVTTRDDLELRAGSAQHQHIVSVARKEGGVRIGLVALDLPSHLSGHSSKDVE